MFGFKRRHAERAEAELAGLQLLASVALIRSLSGIANRYQIKLTREAFGDVSASLIESDGIAVPVGYVSDIALGIIQEISQKSHVSLDSMGAKEELAMARFVAYICRVLVGPGQIVEPAAIEVMVRAASRIPVLAKRPFTRSLMESAYQAILHMQERPGGKQLVELACVQIQQVVRDADDLSIERLARTYDEWIRWPG